MNLLRYLKNPTALQKNQPILYHPEGVIFHCTMIVLLPPTGISRMPKMQEISRDFSFPSPQRMRLDYGSLPPQKLLGGGGAFTPNDGLGSGNSSDLGIMHYLGDGFKYVLNFCSYLGKRSNLTSILFERVGTIT